MTRHSHQDAVSDQVFADLVAAVDNIKPRFRPECELVLFAAGRLGMRAGEIAHLDESWIDWQRSIIEIPEEDPCDHGRAGRICGYCHDRAQAAAAANDDLSLEQALSQRWNPKTSTSARPIPFDFDDSVREVIERFFFDHERYQGSRASVNRRVDRILKAAGYRTNKCYPHALRATAATYHAYRGLSAVALQALLGWADLATAQKYIRLSGGATQKALRDAHADG